MKALTAQVIVDEGELEVLGYPLPEDSKQARAAMGVVPQLDNLDVSLTVEQNLLVFAHLYRVPKADRAPAIEHALAIANLTPRRMSKVDELSGGMRRRLLVARALPHRHVGRGSAHQRRQRPRRRAPADEPRGRVRDPDRRGDRLMSTMERRLGRLEWTALRGVMVREVVNFSSFWRSSTFSSTVDPTIYLLAFGFGFGSLVSTVGGYDYIDFVGTGIVATTVLFAGAFPAMYSTFVKYEFQHTYDAILAAPVDTEELVTGEALWIAARVGVYGTVPMLVAMIFGLNPSWGMLLVPLIAAIAGFGWASFGIFLAGKSGQIVRFSYWQSGLLTPMFLVAGTFFPLTQLPEWAQVLGNLNPLYHCVQLVRDAVFGLWGLASIGHLAFLIGFALLAWRLAVRFMERRLIL